MFVKICGISNTIDASYVNESRADAIGFVLGGLILPAEVEMPAQRAREIIRGLRDSLMSVLVTHLLNSKDIIDLAEYLGCSAIQISEPLSPGVLHEIRSSTKRILIKTVIVQDESSETYLQGVEDHADYILLDTKLAGYVGGTGTTNDWKLCRELISVAKRPVFLAGGLTPANIAAAIEFTKPAGVDVSTGVSCFSEVYPKKDRKDPQKIQRFIEITKQRES